MIPNCNITRQDILRAEDIFGPNRASIKGTTIHPTQHVTVTWTQITKEILEKYREVTLANNIMAINKISFMISTSRNVHFGTTILICEHS